MRQIDVGSGRKIALHERTFHGSARGTADATGTTLWPTALPLLLYLQSSVVPPLKQSMVDNRPLRILELGAGCGVLGLGLAATCDAHVVMTESGFPLDPDDDGSVDTSLTWLERNVAENREVAEAGGGRVDTARLAWGDADDEESIKSRWPDGFDLVVGSDLLYDSGRYDALLSTLTAVAGEASRRRNDDNKLFAVLGYQMRIGAERRFGDDAAEFEVERYPLPTASKAADGSSGRNPTGKNVAHLTWRE